MLELLNLIFFSYFPIKIVKIKPLKYFLTEIAKRYINYYYYKHVALEFLILFAIICFTVP